MMSLSSDSTESSGQRRRRRMQQDPPVMQWPSWLLPEANGFGSNSAADAPLQWSRPEGSRLDVLTTSSNNDQVGVCNLVSLTPFSFDPEIDDYPELGRLLFPGGYASAFATVLAMKHLNHGDGSIVNEIEGLNETCKIRFVPEFIDTMGSTSLATERLLNRLDEAVSETTGRFSPCAFIGGYHSTVSQHTAVITSLNNYTQISGISSSAELNDNEMFAKFARTIPSIGAEAHAFIKYLKQSSTNEPIKYLAILNVDNDWSNNYATRVRQAASALDPNLIVEQVLVDPSSKKTIFKAIQKLEELHFPVILGAFFNSVSDTLDEVMTQAYHQGLAGHGNTTWFFNGDVGLALQRYQFRKGSALHLALRGSGFLNVGGNYPGNPKMTEFKESLLEMKNDPDAIAFFQQVLPQYSLNVGEDINLDGLKGRASLFQHDSMFLGTSELYSHESFLDPLLDDRIQFIYEAALLLGMMACESVTGNMMLDPNAFYSRLQYTTFQGISGNVSLGPSGSRDPNSTSYLMYNAVEQSIDGEKDKIGLTGVLTDVFHERVWKGLVPFVFNDGSTDFPTPKIWEGLTVVDQSRPVEAISYTLCAISISLALLCMLFTWMKRDTRIIRSSQPFFLYALCFGCILFASSIIPMAIGGPDLSLQANNLACECVTWLLFLGMGLVFTMAFSKTYRINKIRKNAKRFKKIEVKVVHVLIPGTVVLLANVIILAVMTALNPVHFKPFVTSTDRFGRPDTVYGHCSIVEQGAYIILLIVINFGVLLLGLFQAWQVRNLSTEFQESESMFRMLMIIVVLLFIGIPVVVIGQDNADSRLFIIASIISIGTCAVLLSLFVPKWRYETKKAGNKTPGTVTITGLDYDGTSTGTGDGRGSLANFSGDFVLSSKTRRELAAEVRMLRKRVKDMESQGDTTVIDNGSG